MSGIWWVIWRVYEGYLESYWRLPGDCFEGNWWVSKNCLEVFDLCLDGVVKVSGECLICKESGKDRSGQSTSGKKGSGEDR